MGRESEHLRRLQGSGEAQHLFVDRYRLVKICKLGRLDGAATTPRTLQPFILGCALGQRRDWSRFCAASNTTGPWAIVAPSVGRIQPHLIRPGLSTISPWDSPFPSRSWRRRLPIPISLGCFRYSQPCPVDAVRPSKTGGLKAATSDPNPSRVRNPFLLIFPDIPLPPLSSVRGFGGRDRLVVRSPFETAIPPRRHPLVL